MLVWLCLGEAICFVLIAVVAMRLLLYAEAYKDMRRDIDGLRKLYMGLTVRVERVEQAVKPPPLPIIIPSAADGDAKVE